jgi:hypothetical protein
MLKGKGKAIYRYYSVEKHSDHTKFIEAFDKKIEFDTQHKPAWMP